MSFMEEVRMMVVNGESGCRLKRKLEWWLLKKMVVVVINGESGRRLQRKWRSFKEKVGRVVVNIEIGELYRECVNGGR